MKKIIAIALVILMCLFILTPYTYSSKLNTKNYQVFGATEANLGQPIVIILYPNNPMMTVNGVSQEIDPGRGTKPVIIAKWSRTVVPIRAIVEALGGIVTWNSTNRRVTIDFKNITIDLWINSPKARINERKIWIDPNNPNVKPIIQNGRTMLPLRFIVESLDCSVDWNPHSKAITIKYPNKKLLTTFGIGTSKNSVLQIMGTPTNTSKSPYSNEETWYYGLSSITFKDNRVYEYMNLGGNLKVWISSAKQNAPLIKIGSIKQNVLDSMGTPTIVSVFPYSNEETWYYGLSSITFKDNRVYEYMNLGGNLKVYTRSPNPNAPLIKKGSTKSSVINSLGTPSSITKFPFWEMETWHYGLSSVNFKNNVVYSWDDFGELQGHVSRINYYIGNEEDIDYSEILPYSLTFNPTSSSLTGILTLPYIQKRTALIYDSDGRFIPFYAENGSYYGQISELTERPKTIYVRGYYRKDGTYVRSHYRSRPLHP